MKGPFKAGQRVKVHWTKDDSILEGNIVSAKFENSDDLAMEWAGQGVHFWDGLEGTMTFIFSKEDAVLEIVRDVEEDE